MKKIFLLTITLCLIILSSCQKDPVVEYVELGKYLPGEWWVTYVVTDENGAEVYNSGYSKLTTSNTAANTATDMWITDNGNFWQFQVKATANVEQKTFSVLEGTDIIYDDNTTVTDGKVIVDGGITKSGNVTDSIYMELEWASDPGTIYICSGVRRTGFLEDEY